MFKKVLILLALSSLFVSCAGIVGMPESEIGKANFFDSSLKALADQYNTEASIATNPEYIKILKFRRAAILNAAGPIRTVSMAVKNGQPISIGMLDAVNVALMQVKQYLLTRHKTTPSEAEIWAMLQRAGVYTRTDQSALSKADKSPWLAIIELIQGIYVMWERLNWQANMDEAQLQADFEVNHAWILSFTADDLVAL